jgi:hypothetical protein
LGRARRSCGRLTVRAGSITLRTSWPSTSFRSLSCASLMDGTASTANREFGNELRSIARTAVFYGAGAQPNEAPHAG